MKLNPFRRRNPFNLSYDHYTAFNQGDLVPVYSQLVYPGDTLSITNWAFVRYAPMIAPKFGRDGLYVHYFFVPIRIIFDKWEQFITGGFDGNDSTEWPHVVAPTGGWTKYSLPDYFGWRLGVAGLKASALKLRAYDLIYNTWYRQEFLQSEVGLSKAEGEDSTTSLTVQVRNWRKDYFTRALPFRQLGTPVQIPISTEAAPVSISRKLLDVKANQLGDLPVLGALRSTDNAKVGTIVGLTGDTGNLYGAPASPGWEADTRTNLIADANGLTGTADLQNAYATSINTLRAGTQVQRWMERNARGGVRYIESILAHFGVRSSDARLQRPEFLGGGKAYTAFSEVLQTSSTNSTSPQGNMSGHGVNAAKTVNFTKSFEEHGLIIGIVSVMTDSMYASQGIPREDSYQTRMDYMWPEFTHLGEQGIKNKEIYAQGPSVVDFDGNVVDENIFGYVPMYDEMRRRPSMITSDMRDSLSFWSQARIFDSLPTLSDQFLKGTHSNRVFAVTDNNVKHLWAQIHFEVKSVRPLPKHGEPGFLDH